ncbi:polyketide synthase, partial [Streptomyces sp. URMC 123]|uniref:beta-ketoacyl [acyl carrier protein] synthase domain-containing protein n=1 Tax=Streptomyces sp. URMC 123 TaxID=3423403 RepID=UPI003F1B74D1
GPGGGRAWSAAPRRRGRPGPDGGPGGGTLDDIAVDAARFGVPPVQARSMARMQMLMLEAARQCLDDAGHLRRPLPAERTDVIAGTCFGLDRQYANALRIEAASYARELERAALAADRPESRRGARTAAGELRELLTRRLGASPHDRVGEMASTIPARIATAFRLGGRTLALESAEATSFLALWHAVHHLRAGVSDAVLVVAGQRHDGPVLARALAAKGLIAPDAVPFAAAGGGFALGEGVGALLLKRLSSAVRDGDRVYASILECAVRHDARPGVFRYSTSAGHRAEVAAACYRAAAVPARSVQYVECAGSGVARETEAELDALATLFAGAEPASVALGSVRDRLGNTVANAGLAAVTKVALALHHRTLPPQWAPARGEECAALSRAPFRLPRTAEPWRPGRRDGSRRAAVLGSSVTGTLCHLVLEEYDSARSAYPGAHAPKRSGAALPARTPEPIAVVGLGGRFAGAADADGFWRAIWARRTGIGPLPAALLDRDLLYRPGELSLTHSYTDQGAAVPAPQAPPPEARMTPLRHELLDGAQRLALAVAAETLRSAGWAPAPRPAGSGPVPPSPAGPGRRGLIAIGSTLALSRDRELGARLALGELEAAVAELAAFKQVPADDLAAVLDRARERHGPPPGPAERLSPALFDGCLASGTAALIAGEFGLDAVPVAVEAACASSLAALDLAMGALRAGAVDFALAGGVEMACNARDLVLCSALGLLSHTRIAPFDAAADGFTPGDGCGLFLLKRLGDARRAGDTVYGLLRGIGASNDAKSLIAPDVAGQVRAMRQAFEQVDFAPADVDYLEAHGTGTRVGDRVEIAAAARVYGDGRHRPLGIGSAKSFVGHTFAAAGAAGLLRTLLAMRARTVPPTLAPTTLNPALELHAIPAVIPTELSPWTTAPGRPRRAGVSSFGTGGINYHLLVEEPTP